MINHITTILSCLQSSSRFASISSTGSRVETSGRGRGRGRGKVRGRCHPNKRKCVSPEVWNGMS